MFFKKITKKTRKADKLIKGIIVGGAIGSVVGMTFAPKSGKETRSFVKNTSTSLFSRLWKKKAPEVIPEKKTLWSALFRKKEPLPPPPKKGIGASFLRGMRALLFGSSKK